MTESMEQSILLRTAKILFFERAHILMDIESVQYQTLNPDQLKKLSENIILLPDDWQEYLLLYYGCSFDAALIADLLKTESVWESILYAKDILAYGLNVDGITDTDMIASCTSALKEWRTAVQTEKESTEKIQTSSRFEKQMRHLMRRQVTLKLRLVMRRAAIVILALLVSSAITVFSVKALRDKFFDWLFSVFPTHTRMEFFNVEQTSEVDDIELMKRFAPAYIPDHYSVLEVLELEQRYKIIYSDNTGKLIYFEVSLIKDGNHENLNTEGASLEEILINGQEGYYIRENVGHTIIWAQDKYLFSIMCETDKTDAIKIAESTKIK